MAPNNNAEQYFGQEEDRPYVPPPGANVEHGIQNINANTNLALLRKDGVRMNPDTGQIEPRGVGPVSPCRLKHLPGNTAEEKRARVRVKYHKEANASAKEHKRILRQAGRLPRDPYGAYKDSAGYIVEGNLLNQYNENWDDAQAIAQNQDQNPAQFENQTIDQSKGAPLAGNAEDEFVNPHATKGTGPTADELEARTAENERKGQLRDLVYNNLSGNDKQIYDAFAEGKTAKMITEEIGYTTAQIASFTRRLKHGEGRVIAASRCA
ncbi:MAG: hypothetical protein WB949_10755 [Candidatus Acidiferrales bacterium]